MTARRTIALGVVCTGLAAPWLATHLACRGRSANPPAKAESQTADDSARASPQRIAPQPSTSAVTPAIPGQVHPGAEPESRPADEGPDRSPQRGRIGLATILLKNTLPGALDRYNLDVGHYPVAEEGGLAALWKRPDLGGEGANEKWRGPYLTREPKDPWGRLLHYETDANGGTYRVWSAGPDGKSGTEDDIKAFSADAENEGT